MINIFKNRKIKNPKNESIIEKSEHAAILINFFIQDVTKETRKLLVSKKFSNSLVNSRTEKCVLLGTEISELADAVKKGYGDTEEAEELADIIIRACNFLCSEETYRYYKRLCHNLDGKVVFGPDFLVRVNKSYFLGGDTIIENKFRVIEAMMESWVDIKVESVKYVNTYLTNGDLPKAFIELWSKLINLFCYCEFYSSNFLDSKLKEAVAFKMNKNLGRPERYNSCEAMYENS